MRREGVDREDRKDTCPFPEPLLLCPNTVECCHLLLAISFRFTLIDNLILLPIKNVTIYLLVYKRKTERKRKKRKKEKKSA